MEAFLEHFMSGSTGWMLAFIIVGAFLVLGKGADLLVEEAVNLSLRWKIPKAIVGATIVSLGTTAPEVVVSVLAALGGNPELALGNAVGSIICDTGLVLGIAILIRPMPISDQVKNFHGWLQLACGFLLVVCCIPFSHLSSTFSEGGRLAQWIGFVFLGLLGIYIWYSIKSSSSKEHAYDQDFEEEKFEEGNSRLIMVKLFIGAVAVVMSSQIAIPAVKEVAIRLHVPTGIIAATLVAFGTSLPELVTAVTSALKGHGEVGLGNIVGADILNVLFVAGASAAVTRSGLIASPDFFKLLFPTMLFVLIVFRIGLSTCKGTLKRPFGFILLGTYLLVTFLSYKGLS